MKSNLRLALPFLLVAVSVSIHAALMTPMSVEELAQSADVILHGTVVSKTVQRDSEGRIYTSVELNIHEVWKGNISRNNFRVVHGGGTLGEEHAVAAGAQVHYEIGEEVVAYLILNPRGEGVTLGLVQGKFHVDTNEKTKEKTVFNVFNGKPAKADKVDQQLLTFAELKRRTTGGKP